MERLELSGIPVEAISIGGIETSIHLPSFKLAIDVGRCPPEIVRRDTVLLTHAHIDHLGGIAFHCATRGLRGMRPPSYVVRPGDVERIEALFEVWRSLDRSDMAHRTIPLAPGEELELPGRTVVKPFHSPHSAPCQGYAILLRSHKLRTRFRGLPGDELARLRREGVELTRTVDVPQVAFPGDTRIEVLDREPLCREARLLILEATFLDGRVSVEQARSKGHVHLDEICERADLFQNEAILLTHFSARYTAHEIRAILARRLPATLRPRVVPLLGGHRAASPRRPAST